MRALIVDGYNVIRRTPPYSRLAEHDLDAARAALVSDVVAFAHGEWDATIVFDGHGNPLSRGLPHDAHGATVIFSAYGVDADAVIEGLARAARQRDEDAVVVTSDAQTQWTVMGGTVGRMSSGEFGEELRHGSREWEGHAPSGDRSGRLEDRIDSEARERLWRWARGID